MKGQRNGNRRRSEVRQEAPVDAGRVRVGWLSRLTGNADSGESPSLPDAADDPPGRGGRSARGPLGATSPAPRGFPVGPLGTCLALGLALAAAAAGPPAAAAEAEVGSEAPLFTLPADRGTDFALASLRGKKHVLLAFYPRSFTPG